VLILMVYERLLYYQLFFFMLDLIFLAVAL